MFKSIQLFLKRFRFLGKGETVVDMSEYISLKLKKEAKPLTMAELTQYQLGSYVPSFKPLADQKDDFKLAMVTFCKQTKDSKYFKYLIEHLKQDQVNNFVFNPTELRPSEEFMRGSINGIYVVEEQIALLGSADENKKIKKEKGNSDS